MRKIYFILFFLSAVFLSIQSASASLTANNSFSIAKILYEPGQQINATAIFGLTGESADSSVVVDINGKQTAISLLDFLKQAGIPMSSSGYTCSNNCRNTYETNGDSGDEKTLNIGENIIGINLSTEYMLEEDENDKPVGIDSLSFTLSSLGTEFSKSCGESSVKIDVLDNGMDWLYRKAGSFDSACSQLSTSNCYRQDVALNYKITNSPYCEKMHLGETSQVKVAAMIKKISSLSGRLQMSIEDAYRNSASCYLPESLTTEYSLQECILDYVVKKPGDYAICIHDSKFSDNNNIETYYILGETAVPKCGYAGSASGIKMDFAIYSQIAEIAGFPSFVFNNEEYYNLTGKELNKDINDYLNSFYSKFCRAGCIIPIMFKLKEKAKVSDFAVAYHLEELSIPARQFEIYNITRVAPLVNMLRKTINLDFLDLRIADEGSYKIIFSIGSSVIGSADINVSSIPKINSVVPQNPVADVETVFFANVISAAGYKIMDYVWDFGDSTIETTHNNTIKHTYSSVASYNLTLSVKDEKGTKASKSFIITTDTPINAVNITLTQKKTFMANFTRAINPLPQWYKSAINKQIGFVDIDNKLKKAEQDFEDARESGEDEKFLEIKHQIDSITVPVSLDDAIIFEEADVLLSIDEINPGNVKEMAGGTYNESVADETKNAIAAWQSENVNMMVNGIVKAVVFEDMSVQNILTIYKLQIMPLKSLESAYLFIQFPAGVSYDEVSFEKNYGQKKLSGAVGIPLTSESAQTINFAMPREQSMTIPLFASPALKDLLILPSLVSCGNTICEKEYGENYKNCREDCSPTARTIRLILLVIVLGAIGVFLIWKFYAVIYERMEQARIFKNHKNYIAILLFVADAFNKGMTEQQIREKLKKSGWNDEQIDYSMKKSKRAEKKVSKKLGKTEQKKQPAEEAKKTGQ